MKETIPKVMGEVVQKVLDETKIKSNNGGFNIMEQILFFHYITGYSNDDLKEYSVLNGRINVNSIDDPLDRIKSFKRESMSIKQLEQYKHSLEKIKKQLSSQSIKHSQLIKEILKNAIDNVDKDIINCDQLIEKKKKNDIIKSKNL